MRRFTSVVFLFLLASPLMNAASSSPGDSHRATAADAKGVNLAGVVSNDRKTVLADDDNAWIVDNTDTLKGFEGRHVTVKCRMNPGMRAIRVLYVVEPETKHTANFRDSAFRR